MSTEEARDSAAVQICFQRYSKFVKFLFGKYAMTRAQITKAANFDAYADKTINLAEMTRLFRDHNVDTQLLSKSMLSDLIRLVNSYCLGKNDLSDLDYKHFTDFLL
jgi:hypothetical protein